jgi:hypothetical protein
VLGGVTAKRVLPEQNVTMVRTENVQKITTLIRIKRENKPEVLIRYLKGIRILENTFASCGDGRGMK